MHRDANHAAYVEGGELFKQGRFGDAAKHFRLAAGEWPEDWQAYWALGNCYSEMKKPRKAEESFREAIMHAPKADVPSLYFNLGNALLDQGKYKEAIEAYGEIPSGHSLAGSVRRNVSLIKERMKNGT